MHIEYGEADSCVGSLLCFMYFVQEAPIRQMKKGGFAETVEANEVKAYIVVSKSQTQATRLCLTLLPCLLITELL